jgi:type 1 glutamine amidotransferase
VLLLWGGYYHDFQTAAGIIWNFLKPFERYEVTATDDRKSLERLDPFDAMTLYAQGGKPTPAEENGILNFVRRGGGLAGIHYGL